MLVAQLYTICIHDDKKLLLLLSVTFVDIITLATVQFIVFIIFTAGFMVI